MKKYLPIALLIAGAVVLALVFILLRGQKKVEPVNPDSEESLVELPLEKRPVVSLLPIPDKDGKFGHYLKLKVEKIQVDADSADFTLEYKTENNILQGVPGVEKYGDKKEFESDLLLGTESSGKFRYDEGVENGSVELKFRKAGKLVAKLKTDFHMQTNTDLLTSSDSGFGYKLAKKSKATFVTMNTLGLPVPFQNAIKAGPFGVFSSETSPNSGTISTEGKYLRLENEEWKELENSKSQDIGFFIAPK